MRPAADISPKFRKFAHVNAFSSILLACYFFLAGLMPNMDFCDLSKIPGLAAHFLEHNSSAKDMSLEEFMAFHYGNENQEPADEHSLPFKDHNCCPAGHTLTLLTTAIEIDFNLVILDRDLNQPYVLDLTSRFSNSIWQPPQSV